MKKLLLLVFFAASLVSVCAQDFDKTIDAVKQKYAPDKRTAVYAIKAVRTNGPVVFTGQTSVPQAREALLDSARNAGVEFLDAITVLPDAKSLQDKTYGVIRICVGTLRYGPSYSSEQATQLLLGAPVRILKKDDWYLVQTPENYIAWVSSSAVTPMTREQYNGYVAEKKVIYLADCGWIYEKPDAASQRVTDVVAGCILLDKGEAKGKWLRVALVDGREGYVNRADTKDFTLWAQTTRPTAENVIKNAYRFMGVSYLWAGTSTKMLDCSGFAKTVYMLNGVVLARDASQQCLTGENIDVDRGYENLRPGDLVFFGNRTADGRPNRVWHVGIYVGDGRFIHEAGDVHVNSFNPAHAEYSAYYVERLVRACRIIGNQDKGLGITSFENNPYYNVQP